MQLHISNDPPTSRVFLEAASLEIGSILNSYIAIHDDIFRFSLRRILPLPVIFQSMDYDEYFRRLFYLDETLAGIAAQFPERSDEVPELLSVIKSYCDALRAAMSALREICGSLMEKAAHQKSYGWSNYQRDLARHNTDVTRYREIGQKLNALLSR